jgi:DNA-binding NarL/FixJ family response regulator
MSGSFPSLKLLVVDDSLLLREKLCFSLGCIEGIVIAGKAASVSSGIEAFRAIQPDVVILDLQIPGGTGIDVLEVIMRERPETRVAVYTNHPLPQLRAKCEAIGAEWFFDKTQDSKKLRRMLQELASARRDKAGRTNDKRT